MGIFGLKVKRIRQLKWFWKPKVQFLYSIFSFFKNDFVRNPNLVYILHVNCLDLWPIERAVSKQKQMTYSFIRSMNHRHTHIRSINRTVHSRKAEHKKTHFLPAFVWFNNNNNRTLIKKNEIRLMDSALLYTLFTLLTFVWRFVYCVCVCIQCHFCIRDSKFDCCVNAIGKGW